MKKINQKRIPEITKPKRDGGPLWLLSLPLQTSVAPEPSPAVTFVAVLCPKQRSVTPIPLLFTDHQDKPSVAQ